MLLGSCEAGACESAQAALHRRLWYSSCCSTKRQRMQSCPGDCAARQTVQVHCVQNIMLDVHTTVVHKSCRPMLTRALCGFDTGRLTQPWMVMSSISVLQST